MGIHKDTMDFFWETIGKDRSLKGVWLLDLGDQAIRKDAKVKYDPGNLCIGKAKIYFLRQRCVHHSIDWNGLDGAVPLDMTKPVSIERYINAFDIINDFGCVEHISGYGIGDLPINKSPLKNYSFDKVAASQWQVWKNIHDMGKVGCIYIHTLPLLGSVRGHGYFHYTLEFFSDLCKANNYKPILSRVVQHDKRHHRRDYVFTSYMKMDDKPFAPEAKEFKEWLYR